VLVLEAAGHPGGTTGSDKEGGFLCDWGSNGFLDREPLTLAWAEELGLGKELVRANAASARRFVYRNGRLHEIVPPPRFFLSPLLTLRGRLRLCYEPLARSKRDDAPESIHDFAARRIGREAAEILVGAMVLGIYGGDARQLSMVHCFPRMAAMEREHGSLFNALRAIRRQRGTASPMGPSGTLTTFRQGIGQLPLTAAQLLGPALRYASFVLSMEHRQGRYLVRTKGGEAYLARAVVIATPAHAAARILSEMAPAAAAALGTIPYAGLSVVCVGYPRQAVDHDLSGFGFLAPRGQGISMLGCIWTSSLFPFQAPEGRVLFRCMFGGATDPLDAQLPDDVLLDRVRQELHPLLGIRGDPELVRIYRHPQGIPQYTLHHGKILQAIGQAEARFPGLVFSSNAYRGIGLNDCVVSAESAAARIVAMLRPA